MSNRHRLQVRPEGLCSARHVVDAEYLFPAVGGGAHQREQPFVAEEHFLRTVGMKRRVCSTGADEVEIGVEHLVAQRGTVRQLTLQFAAPELLPVDGAIPINDFSAS